MKNTPKRIYLQVDPKNEKPEDFNELTEVTWCQDKIFDTDICYIRAGKKIDKKLDDILCCYPKCFKLYNGFFTTRNSKIKNDWRMKWKSLKIK